MSNPKLAEAFTFASNSDWPRVVPAARQAVASDPEDASAHALLALGLAHLEQGQEAVAAGRRAVALDPDMAFAHYAHGWALLEHDDVKGAEQAAREALRLDPGPDEHGLLSHAFSRQHRWAEALEMAEGGLEIEPEHQGCANFRALALTNLGRVDEADAALHGSLAFDPDNAYSHANRGWLLLRQSKVDHAVESFRTALRLDPSMDWARLGIIEAMKARSGVYRLFLRYSFWSNSLTARTRWLFFMGLYFLSSLARNLLRQNPALWPVLAPLLAAYVIFVLGSWVSDPLSNLFLRLDSVGRLALNRFETQASNVVGLCLLISLAAFTMYLLTNVSTAAVVGVVSGLLLIPIGGAAKADGTRAWRPMALAAAILVAFATVAVLASALGWSSGNGMFAAVIVAAVLWSWIASFLLTKYL
jgi:tetratricopeptide (TPR) repeat protein